MQQGKAPQMIVEVISRKTGVTSTRTISMELHHTNIPQRVGGIDVHSPSNLSILTPWQHEAADTYRHVGSDLLNVIKDIDVF